MSTKEEAEPMDVVEEEQEGFEMRIGTRRRRLSPQSHFLLSMSLSLIQHMIHYTFLKLLLLRGFV